MRYWMPSNLLKQTKMKKEFDPLNWDWYAYLKAPKDVQKKYHNFATELAASWVTCACGQLCKDLPRGIDSAPEDVHLETLGMDFMSFIRHEKINEAKETLDRIEQRAVELLKQQRQ